MFGCVFMRALLCNGVWFVFLCVFVCVLVCVCVLRMMSLHAVCVLSCDDVWCSMCVCVCVLAFCLCGLFAMHYVMLCAMLCVVCCVVLCVVCCCCLNMFGCFDCDLVCDVAWFVVALLLL